MAFAWCANAIDLTPHFSDMTVGGLVQRRMFFVDGNQKVSVNMDFQTRVEAGSGGAVFRFLRVPNAFLILRPSPMSADEPFVGVSLLRYREAAHRFLPPGVASVESLEEISDPITSHGWHSFRFAYSYIEQGTPRICSVTFINIRPEEQIVMLVAAPSKDFDDAAHRSWFIVRTWQVLPAENGPAAPSSVEENPGR
ncbi:hypothetical protein [Chthoniobacter flavus]|uniref:hypothetical protein n=1 Tax=Chthoniobacter flavus TaxID=191863 RepID=UPI0010439C0D|nr:hypothetical protein [Chthoniobacter flavus]